MKSFPSFTDKENTFAAMYTKEQLQILCLGWGCEIPSKAKKVIKLKFDREFGYENVCIAYTDKKGTYGDRLYLIEMWND